jgi:hypothetical protein
MTAKPSILRFVTHPRLIAAIRTVLILAIVIAGWRVGRSYVALFTEWRQLGRPVSGPRAAAGRLDAMPAVLPLAGQWTFAELDWTARTESKSAQEVDAFFDSMAQSPLTDTDGQLPDLDGELVDLINNFQIKPVERGGNQIYSLDQPDLKAQLVVRSVGGRDKIVAFAVAYSQADGHWQLAKFTPRVSTTTSDATTPHLLPLPAAARRSGGRYDDGGRLLMELVELDSNADALLSAWKIAGWDVRPSGMGGPDDFSYLCAREDEMVYAWSAHPRNALKNLMLVRSPAASDTKP